MPARGKSKKASPKKPQMCACALAKASTCDKELGCGNCNRKMTSAKWGKVKQAEDKKWEAEVNAGKAGVGVEAESDVTAGGKETPRGKETLGGDDDTEDEEEEGEEEKKVGGAKKRAKGATRGKDVVEEEEEEEQIEDEVAKDAGEDEGLVLLFCS